MREHRRKCRWFHRWEDIDAADWIGGIAPPVFRFRCRRCGATKIVRVTP